MIAPLASIFTDIPEAILVFFHDILGSWGWSIVALTFAVRIAILPLSIKQIRSMRALQALQPQLKAIQEKYKPDKDASPAEKQEARQRQQKAMMKFYQENNINPLASCFPLLLQLPVFIALFAMLRGESFRCEVRNDVLEAQGCPEPIPNEGFGFIESLVETPVGVALPVLIVLFVVTQLLAGLAMVVRGQELQGPMKFMIFGLPFAFAPFVATFPAGLSIYWITTNIWTFGQQQVVMSLMPPPPQVTPEEIEEAKPPPPPPRKRKKKRGGKRK